MQFVKQVGVATGPEEGRLEVKDAVNSGLDSPSSTSHFISVAPALRLPPLCVREREKVCLAR